MRRGGRDTDRPPSSEGEELPLERELRLLRDALDRNTRAQISLRRRFLIGLVQGLGAVLGATVLLSLVLGLLRPFTSLDVVGPIVERVMKILEEHQTESRMPGSSAPPSGSRNEEELSSR